jgi:hypothetical protein
MIARARGQLREALNLSRVVEAARVLRDERIG